MRKNSTANLHERRKGCGGFLRVLLLRLTTYEKGVIVTIESRDEDGKLIRVVGMETENPSVAESTAKNPRERQMSFPFVVLGSTYGCARF